MHSIFGIIGFGKIAKVHLEHLHALGLRPHSILVRNSIASAEVSAYFRYHYDYLPSVTCDERKFFRSGITHAMICSPPDSHFIYLLRCLDHRIITFVEKPLFSCEDWSNDVVEQKLEQIFSHPNKNFRVNTANNAFVEAILSSRLWPKIKSFKFVFHTHGHGVGTDVLIDLLPHGMSMVTSIFGFHRITNLSISTSGVQNEHAICSFEYNKRLIEIDVKHDKNHRKRMELSLNGVQFTRCQTGSGKNYNVALYDVKNDSLIEMKDPFMIELQHFIQGQRQYKNDRWNMSLLSEVVRASIR